jgi:hypothetical protein
MTDVKNDAVTVVEAAGHRAGSEREGCHIRET